MAKKVAHIDLKIVIPEDERPSILGRMLRSSIGYVEGCFLPLVFVSLIIVAFRRIFQHSKTDKQLNVLKVCPSKLVVIKNELFDEYQIDCLSNFKIFYNTANFIHESDYTKYSKLEFSIDYIKYHHFFTCSKSQYLKLCKMLYGGRVSFKEYKNENRVFLGKKKNYSQIQEIKSEYGVDW